MSPASMLYIPYRYLAEGALLYYNVKFFSAIRLFLKCYNLYKGLKSPNLSPVVSSPPYTRSTHSVRGGAFFAFSLGVPADQIKIQGDWSSDCYLRYLSSPLSHKQKLVSFMASHILKVYKK